ncbi:hypothetical protein KVR01_010810 [Diaporthe batatas]|uniref:uncharacterized protein n=1 Tax=Diaporthe batatas TaxID=748121 RepID=UPI001D0477D4|nr:uncharacterized protein KVR01_010810 [Diaporthe batatas]KAG8159149.1 hypothetical protein KVR01_010810 [Diaporthe batatas]
MGVPINTALRWEREHKYQFPSGERFSKALLDSVTCHFAKVRTRDWETRMMEYWNPNENDIRDNGEYESFKSKWRMKKAMSQIDLGRWAEAEAESGAEQYLRDTIEKCKQLRRSNEFHGFMYLPGEIRDIIYRLALFRGKVVVPNSRHSMGPQAFEAVENYESFDGYYYRRYEGVTHELHAMRHSHHTIPLGLIQGVSRAVHDEAARIYFGSNQFIFPSGSFVHPRYCNLRTAFEAHGGDGFQRDIDNRTNNAPLLRDVSYTFDMRDHPIDDHTNLYMNYGIKASVDDGRRSRGEALQALHDAKALELEIDWAERIDSIKLMTLDRLVLDFQECYCPIGCCRKVQWVVDRFLHEGPPPGTAATEDNAYSSYDWFNRPPRMVEVMGFVDDKEELTAMVKLRRLIGSVICLIETNDVPNDFDRPMQELLLSD